MAERTLQAKLKVRSDTATKWQSNNPVLLQGEPALETDTNKLKFGDGTSAYNDLPYISSDAVTVEANPADEATQTLEKLRVENNVYSIPQGTEVIDLGTVTLTEQDLGGVKVSFADSITVSTEQATQAQAASPCIAKVIINGAAHEFNRIAISSDASAAYVVFTATKDEGGESICFYRLQISIPLTGGTASASLFVFEYTILGGLNSAYKAGGLTFENGVATKTLTEEEVGEWGYNQIRFWDNANSSEQYTLYLSHNNTGASLIDSHNYDYFGIVENASVTGEAGGITAFSAYLEGTTLTIERITIGGSGVEVVDLGSVTVTTGQGTSVTVTSEQWNKIASAQHPKIKLQMLNTSIGANDPLPLELDYVTTSGDAQISVIQYQKVALWEATSSGVHQLATAMLVMINNNNTITAQFHWYISLINNGIPAGGLAGQALTKQSGADYDVAWTSINTSEPTVITEAAYAEALEAGTIEDDKLYYIQGTSDNTLNVSQTAQTISYDNSSSGLTATNVQGAIDEVKADIPANGDFTLAGLSEKSYNNLTDKPTIPTLDVASIATALGLTTTQLNNLITLSKSITSASSSEVVISGTLTASSFNTNA